MPPILPPLVGRKRRFAAMLLLAVRAWYRRRELPQKVNLSPRFQDYVLVAITHLPDSILPNDPGALDSAWAGLYLNFTHCRCPGTPRTRMLTHGARLPARGQGTHFPGLPAQAGVAGHSMGRQRAGCFPGFRAATPLAPPADPIQASAPGVDSHHRRGPGDTWRSGSLFRYQGTSNLCLQILISSRAGRQTSLLSKQMSHFPIIWRTNGHPGQVGQTLIQLFLSASFIWDHRTIFGVL